MANNWDYEQTSAVFNDTKVDAIAGVPSGQIDQLANLSIDIPDNQIIKNLDNRIEDSVGYWDDPSGFNLKQSRNENLRFYLGKQNDVRSLYRFQTPYVENQIYVAEQAITAYLTANTPQAEVSPASDSPMSKQFAMDLEKVAMAHSLQFNVQQLLETSVKNALNKRLGLIYLSFDPNDGIHGEIVPVALNPEEVIIDKNAKMGEDPDFICRMVKMSLNEVCSRWPDKKEQIYKEAGIIRGTPNQLDQIMVIREVWLTYYDKKYKAHQALVYYFNNCVLEKSKNPNWIYAKPEKNFMNLPMKPFIPLNLDNDGQHWIDYTSAVEQAAKVQVILNKRGRQLMEVADKANGILVIDTKSGMTKDDVQDLTDDPNQRIVISPPPNVRAQDVIFRLPPPEIPQMLFQDKVDQRTTIHAIMGTPSEFTGSNDGSSDPETLGQSMMKKNQASGRQDLYVRCIDRFMNHYFQYLVQMMAVWYTDKHFFTHNSGDGEFDYLTIHRDLIEPSMSISVKGGTSLPFDKHRQEAVVLQLMKMGASISLLDAYKLLHMENPQKLYDNWAKQKTDPMSLARNGLDEIDEAKAYIAFVELMAGKTPTEPDHITKEYILTLRKLMLRDEFLQAKKANQRKFLDFVEKCLKRLELSDSLDQMSQQGPEALDPNTPIQPPQQMGPPGMPPMGQPPMGPPMMPPQAPGPQGAPMPGMPGQVPGPMPPMPQGMPPGMPPPQMMGPGPSQSMIGGSLFSGTNLPNPANPQMPNSQNPMTLPGL